MIQATDFDRMFLAATPMLDLRAPQEYARGAFPTATNIPLLEDRERHEVGLRYKQAGAEAAVELGHRLVAGDVRAARVAAWCAWADAHPDGVIYCWRGGQRSAIVRAWLAAEGRARPRIEGGYKALRQHLLALIDRVAPTLPLRLLGGRTGTGKTRILERIHRSLDLEGLAHHRGSAFGSRITPQPPPAGFENALAIRLLELAAGGEHPLVVEDESRNIGRLSLPEPLIRNMAEAPIALVEAPLEQRVTITLEAYIVAGLSERRSVCRDDAFETFADWLRSALHRIRKRLGGARHQELVAMLEDALARHAATGDAHHHRGWITRLLAEYYDPMYDYQLRQKAHRIVFRGDTAAVTDWLAREVEGDLALRERPRGP